MCGPALEEINTKSIDDIQSVIKTPDDAVASVILLDQMPRNIFRGDQAVRVSPNSSSRYECECEWSDLTDQD